jgi:hypothetical protein
VLAAAGVAAKSCGRTEKNVTYEEAIELAAEEASFEPCAEKRCTQVKYIQRGIPVRGYWAVVLSDELGEDNQPSHVESFLVNAATGEVTRP